MDNLILFTAMTSVALLLSVGVLHLLPILGITGRRLSEVMCRAPMLDLIITWFTIAPLVVGPILYGWLGLLGAVLGQIASVLVWSILHSLAHPTARRGPRIVKSLNRIVGPWRNYTAVWVTALAVPLFWIVRIAEIFLYPALIWLVRFPKYNQGEWINVSRHKFDGLVGHDLIWCLYCDWMTGVWSLGSEMLRNVESFWCPIRFYNDKKCENCKIDFPDLTDQWVAADKSIEDVAKLLESQYASGKNAWFGHPTRLTVEGKSPELK